MTVDLETKGADLVRATRPSVLGPDEVRRRAQHRRGRARLGWVGAAGVLTVLLAVIIGWSSAPNRSSVHVAAPSPTRACTDKDLQAGPARVGVATGSLVATLTITGTSGDPCQVPTATAVELLDTSGSAVRADYTSERGSNASAVLVSQSGAASIRVQTSSRGGYPSPNCTHIGSVRVHFGASVLAYAVDSEACSASPSVSPQVIVSAVLNGSDATTGPTTSVPPCDPKQVNAAPC